MESTKAGIVCEYDNVLLATSAACTVVLVPGDPEVVPVSSIVLLGT